MEKSVNTYDIGDVVMATAGRGCGHFFIVTGIDNEYVFLSDGDTRKLNHEKKKKVKHLKPAGQHSEQIAVLLQSGQLKDADIRTMLKEVK